MYTMTIDEIRALAEEVAATFNPQRVAPFPYERILEKHADLKIYFTELDDGQISGATLFEDEEFTILINSSKPATRQHFSLGHELGHYFLHAGVLKEEKAIIDSEDSLAGPRILYRQENTSTEQLEREANAFAATLIMPAGLVREGWLAVADIEKLAQIFQVSVVAMSIRLTELGLVV
jgi:Zn-dependent peptidase ImmA (M78 family)